MSIRVPSSKRLGCSLPLWFVGLRRIVTFVPSSRNSGFDPGDLHGSVIAIPLLERMQREKATTLIPVVIDLNYRYPFGLDAAAVAVRDCIDLAKRQSRQRKREVAGDRYAQYVFAWLTAASIRRVVSIDRERAQVEGGTGAPAIYRIWPDFETRAFINISAHTVKADAARMSFAATGKGIVWAVLDSGIDPDHPHFKMHDNLVATAPLQHLDFTDRRAGHRRQPTTTATAPTSQASSLASSTRPPLCGDRSAMRALT